MNEIWANRLVAGDKLWSNVPASRKSAVKDVLHDRVGNGLYNEITAAQYETITGEVYTA
jgi:hypothetical protein